MKKPILILLLTCICFLANSQIRTFSPTGTRMSDPAPVTINGTATLTTLFTDSISGNNLTIGKYYTFRIDLALTTPLINIGTLTLTLKYGTGTLVVASSSALVGSLTNSPVIITGTIVSRGTNSQYVTMNVSQPQGNAISLTPSNSAMQGTMSVDATTTQTVLVTAQLGGTTSGTIITRNWAIKYDF